MTTLLENASLLVPNGLVADADGNVYVAGKGVFNVGPTLGGAIYKITPDGKYTVFAGGKTNDGTPVDGTGAAATFSLPQLVGIDQGGNMYLSDGGRYRMITPQAIVSTIASLPAGLGAAPDGNIYSIDATQSVVYRTAPDGSGKTIVAGVAGQSATVLGALPGGLDHPAAIVPMGPGSFAVISASAVLKLVLPY